MRKELVWERPGQDDVRFRQYLVLALIQSGVCVLLEDGRGEYLFIANLLGDWPVNALEIPDDASLFGADIAERIALTKAEARQSGAERRIEIAQVSGKHFEFIFHPVNARDNRAGDLMTTVIDLSEERQRQRALRALLREVSHRSKNLLAIIQSLAAQTARHSGTLDQFLKKFQGRLYSLSHSQDLITESSWRGAFFRDLVRDQTQKYLPDTGHLITVEGENLLLPPNVSMHVGLALHELVVNAVTHGALASGGPSIQVHCRRIPEKGGDAIEIGWTESLKDRRSEAPEETAGKPQFGSVVLESIVPASVSGTGDYSVTAGHIDYRLTFPVKDNL